MRLAPLRTRALPALLLLPFLVACQSGTRGENATGDSLPVTIHADEPDVLVYGRSKDSLTLDPAAASDGESAKVIDNIFETLVDFDTDPENPAAIVPNLATDWGFSADRMTWQFKLREGVRFHDGEAMDAHAVKFSLERLVDSKHPFAPERVPYRSTYARIESVEAINDHEIRILLREPSVVLLRNLSMFAASIVSPKAVKKWGGRFGSKPVGTGPFQLWSWDAGQNIVLARNDRWWSDPAPTIKKLVFLQIEDWEGRREGLKSGRIHLTDNIQPKDIEWLQTTPGIVVKRTPGMNVCYLAMNTERAGLDNPAVRRAIAMAVDRERVLRVGYSGAGRIARDLLPDNIPGSDKQIVPDRDAVEARSMLADVANKKPLRLWYMNNQRPYLMDPKRVALIIRDCLTEIGLEVTVEGLEWSEYLSRLKAGEHELALIGWTTDNGDPDNFYSTLLGEGSIGETNYTRLRSAKFETLLAASREEEDRPTRLALFRRMQDLLLVECPCVPLVHTNVAIAHRTNVKNIRPHPIKVRLYAVSKGDG